jgi:hypothetical protein
MQNQSISDPPTEERFNVGHQKVMSLLRKKSWFEWGKSSLLFKPRQESSWTGQVFNLILESIAVRVLVYQQSFDAENPNYSGHKRQC